MADNDTDQLAAVQELYNRRAKLDPVKRAMVDELAKRFKIAAPQQSAAQQLGITNPWAAAPLDLVEGAGAGVMSTVRGVSKLAHKVVPAIPEVPEEYAQAPDSVAGQVGKYGEQAAEFMLPMGAVGKGAKAVETATAGVKAAPVINAGARALLEGAAAGTVATAQTGDVEEGAKAGAIGGATSAGLQAVAPVVQKALPLVRNKLNPVMQVAMDWAEKHGVPLSTGQRTGNQMVTRLERGGLENTFGSSGRTQEFFQNQEKQLEAAGRDLINSTQPGRALNEYEAGQNLSQRVQNVISDAKANADTLYDDVRQSYAQNSKTVQVGRRPIVGQNGQPMLDARGNVMTAPVTQTFELPVDITKAKAGLKPIYDELMQTMPEAKRQMSPGFQALKQLMDAPDVMDAVTADRNLSAIKALARGGNNQFLNTRSQGLAKLAIKQIESDFDSALQTTDPGILSKLQQARAHVRNQHAVAEILNGLPDEPAALYQRLTSAGDRTYNDLAFLNRVAPQEMRQVGRTYLDGMMQKATSEGGFHRSAGLMQDWNRLGPKTKLLMFGSQQAVDDLDKFWMAAKQLTRDPNPSGSGKVIYGLGILGAGIDALRSSGGDPKEMGKRLGTDLGALAVTSNVLSRLLLTPGGAKFLTGAVRLPPASAGFRQAVNGLTSLMTREERESLKQPTSPPPAQPEPEPQTLPTKFTVTDPRGVVHAFASQEQADAFKQAAGL